MKNLIILIVILHIAMNLYGQNVGPIQYGFDYKPIGSQTVVSDFLISPEHPDFKQTSFVFGSAWGTRDAVIPTALKYNIHYNMYSQISLIIY